VVQTTGKTVPGGWYAGLRTREYQAAVRPGLAMLPIPAAVATARLVAASVDLFTAGSAQGGCVLYKSLLPIISVT
jgi:hypothetical protein